MVATESVTIKVPVGMSKYLVTVNPETELTRNALLLYPYILNQTISHGLLMDEAKGRNVSSQMGLQIMGTIGILMAAYEEHELTSNEVRECIDGLQRAGRHIGQRHYHILLSRLND